MGSQPQGSMTEARPARTVPEVGEILLLIGRIGDRRVALPVSGVQRVLPMAKLTKVPGMPQGIAGVLNLQGTNLPVVDPRSIFGLPACLEDPGQSLVLVLAIAPFLFWLDAVEQIVSAQLREVPPGAVVMQRAFTPFLVSVDGETIPVLSVQEFEPKLMLDPEACIA
ncbi:MAG: chemotaxis protein CheW [Chloroflexi bacterium]|nr:chemotaxis protein CheW [Chloroflexota bacterium]